MNYKLLIISGPTATGKTDLAVKLAQKYHGELISADSRQIYKDLNIGVGKDHPANTPIHLIDVISPRLAFSASQFRLLALSAISDIHSRGKLPILVGCTGFYIDAIINPHPTFSVKPNKILRFFLNHLNINLLQLILRLLDFQTFNSLNHSDLFNPRRLIRKIEIKLSSSLIRNYKVLEGDKLEIKNYNILHLSLTAANSILYQRIDTRVENRLKIGHLDELKSLLKNYSWSDPGLKVSAYASFRPYFQNKSTLDACVQRWKYAEHRDARHQETWFKNQPNPIFLDVSKPINYPKIHTIIDKWYNKP